jgi:hypothetical protein
MAPYMTHPGMLSGALLMFWGVVFFYRVVPPRYGK